MQIERQTFRIRRFSMDCHVFERGLDRRRYYRINEVGEKAYRLPLTVESASWNRVLGMLEPVLPHEAERWLESHAQAAFELKLALLERRIEQSTLSKKLGLLAWKAGMRLWRKFTAQPLKQIDRRSLPVAPWRGRLTPHR